MEHAGPGSDASAEQHRFFWIALLGGSALSLVVCASVAAQWIILGAPEAGWYYGYVRPFTVRPLGAALLVSGMCSVLLLVARPAPGVREWILVFAWIAVAMWLQGLLRSLTPITFERIFVSDAAYSFYSVIQLYDPGTVLGQFAEVRANSPIHAQSNMPGKLMLLYALQVFTARPDVLPWLVVLVSNLGGVFMYLFVRELFRDRQVALYAFILYLFVPAKLLFFPLMNTVTPVVALGCAYLLLQMTKHGSAVYAAVLGAAIYALVFFEPLPLAMGLLFAALLARAVWRREIRSQRILLLVIVGAAAFVATHAAMFLAFGFDLVDAIRQIGAHAVEFNAVWKRPYATWLHYNLWEFLFGVGVCQAVLACVILGYAVRRFSDWRSVLLDPIVLLSASLLATLIVVDLIGVNRGEVIRLWIFLACFFQIPAAYVCARVRTPVAILLVLSTTVLQAALATAMMGFIVV